jgi:hypothetical protein
MSSTDAAENGFESSFENGSASGFKRLVAVLCTSELTK